MLRKKDACCFSVKNIWIGTFVSDNDPVFRPITNRFVGESIPTVAGLSFPELFQGVNRCRVSEPFDADIFGANTRIELKQ